MPWAQVRLARVACCEPIPTLEEVLGTWPEIRLNIDPKDNNAVEPLINSIKKCNAVDRVCIGSFSGRRLLKIRSALGDQLCTSVAPVDAIRLRIASLGISTGGFPAPCAQVPATRGPLIVVDEKFITAAHDRDIMVHVWTINNREQMGRLLDIGVDGIMTDEAQVLRDVLLARGQWVSA
jgi:glycerophosphoryl diester phosphodiesterase